MKKTKVDMRGMSLLRLEDLTHDQMMYLIDLADTLKKQRRFDGNLLKGRHIALVFEKMSTRTRCAAAVAMADEGGRSEYLSATEIHLGKKESTSDTARVLGRMFDGIFFRGYEQKTVELLAEYSKVPVWNGLTDECHPTQALADLMTIRENFPRLQKVKVVYMGDGRNNVATSLMTACAMAGMEFVNCTPKALAPSLEMMKAKEKMARLNGGVVSMDHNPSTAVKNANVIYTDVWVSMGEESQHDRRMKLLKPYQVNMGLMKRTGNLESGKVIFLHCLPAFHDSNTELTAKTGALEVTDEVFEAPFSKVFDLAENRLHTIKALFVATLSRKVV